MSLNAPRASKSISTPLALFAIALLTIAIAEALASYFFSDRPQLQRQGSYLQDHFSPSDELGYGAGARNNTISSRVMHLDKVIYDVTYTIDGNGLRASPPRRKQDQAFFFGCSYTFGEGVGDQETFPVRLGEIIHRNPVNFGFHGYGPHQMLRSLEIDLPRSFGYERASFAVYVALPTHIDRAKGRSSWDLHGPKYEILNGDPHYMGPFSRLPRVVASLIYGSNLGSLLSRITEVNEAKDRDLYLAILRQSDRILHEKYGTSLDILLWDVGPQITELDRNRAAWLKNTAPKLGLQIVALSELSPELGDDRFYFPADHHPTAEAYDLAAKRFARHTRLRHPLK